MHTLRLFKSERGALMFLRTLWTNQPDDIHTSLNRTRSNKSIAKAVLFFLGGGISLILASVGLMNFINSIS